jgi:hypothetical protein
MNSQIRVLTLVLFASACVSLAGCGASATTASAPPAERHDEDHDHDRAQDHQHEAEHDAHIDAPPESLAEALTEVAELHATIKEANAAGELHKADEQVHKIGHLLEEIPKHAAKQSLPEADRQALQEAVDQLFENFGALDERLHHGESAGKSYDEVADQIAEAMEALRAVGKQEQQP